MIPIVLLAALAAACEWLVVPWCRARQWAEVNEMAWRAEQVRRMNGGQ